MSRTMRTRNDLNDTFTGARATRCVLGQLIRNNKEKYAEIKQNYVSFIETYSEIPRRHQPQLMPTFEEWFAIGRPANVGDLLDWDDPKRLAK